jgi:hypothetical protein
VSELIAATSKYQETVTDPKAAVVMSMSSIAQPGVGTVLLPNLIMFYDGPEPPAGIFDDFVKLPQVTLPGQPATTFGVKTLSGIVGSPGGSDAIPPR